MSESKQKKNVALFYFSGTGNTKFICDLLKQELENRGCNCDLFSISKILLIGKLPSLSTYDLIGLAHPVHALETPSIVHNFVQLIPEINRMPVFIIKSSAGGEDISNSAVSQTIGKKLHLKGYNFFYDRTLIMGSGWLIRFQDSLTRELAQVAQNKVKHLVSDLISETPRLTKTNPVFHFTIRCLYIAFGVTKTIVGKDLYTNNKCNLCGKCVINCPVQNIIATRKKIKFGWHCSWCMKCLYACPRDAINYRIAKPFKVAGGFNLDSIISGEDKDSSHIGCKINKHFRNYIQNTEV